MIFKCLLQITCGLILWIGMALLFFVPEGSAYVISDIEVKQISEETAYVIIKADEPIVYEDFIMDNPHRIVIDCKNAQNKVSSDIIEGLKAQGVNAIRVEQRELFEELPEPIVRIVIDLGEGASHLTFAEENNLVVAIDILGFSTGQGIPTERAPSESLPNESFTPPEKEVSVLAEEPAKVKSEYSPPPISSEADVREELPHYKPGDDFVIVDTPPDIEESEEVISPIEDEKLISFDLIDADIRNVLRFLADYGNVNIIANNSVSGRISMRLMDVPWRRAMTLILDMGRFVAVEEEDGIIRVVSRAEFEQIERQELRNQQELEDLLPLQTEVIKVQYAKAAEMASALSRVKSRKGSIQVDVRTNSLIINDLPDYIKDAKVLLDQLDTYIPQVVIQAKVITISPSATKNFGINWGAGNFGNPLVDTHAGGTASLGLPGNTELRLGTLLSTIDIDAIINLLEDNGLGEKLSEPRITVLDNGQAKIHAGQARTRTERSTEGAQVQQTTEDIGITLLVKPQVIGGDKVLLELYVEVSSVAPEAAGMELINKDDATTTVMVDNKSTAVIGGLMSTDRTKSRSYIPFLGHLPLFGRLFRSEQDVVSKRELMIFVTPTVIKPPPRSSASK